MTIAIFWFVTPVGFYGILPTLWNTLYPAFLVTLPNSTLQKAASFITVKTLNVYQRAHLHPARYLDNYEVIP